MIAAAAYRSPHHPAIVTDTDTRTHGDLLRDTDQMAWHLTGLGIEAGHSVAILCDHIPEAVVGMIAVMKTGAAYVPLDPKWPDRRIRSLLADTGASAILVDAAWLERLSTFAWDLPRMREIICVDVDTESPWADALDRDTVRELWDRVATATDPLEAAGFNWATDRTGYTYTASDVDTYIQRVVDLTLHGRGARCDVLEIGCGSGLIVRALAPLVDSYHATDPSGTAVAAIGAWADLQPTVTTEQGFADEILPRVTGTYDRIVLASVTQFMPSVGYLLATLSAAARATRPSGRIVIADVIGPEDIGHSGLHVPPAFFESLAARDGAIADVRVLPRDSGAFAGDLAARYDVVIEIAATPHDTTSCLHVTTSRDIVRASADPYAAKCTTNADAYIIFTSGSTGSPKGVIVRHRSVVNLIDWVNRTFEVGPGDMLLMTTSFAFDLSVYDMFGILAAGATVRLVTDVDRSEPETLANILVGEPVTFWDSAPAAMSAVLPFLELVDIGPTDTRPMRLTFLSGDWVPLSMPDRIRALFPAAEVVALGGATECTVWSNYYLVGRVDPNWPSIPYGKPIQNARYYVLDDQRRVLPVDTVGDLYIGGTCVAAGYAGDSALTSEKFVPDVRYPEAIMYKTGDQAKWLDDGTMRFCGRHDHQVKVRGYRIELGEVQAAMEHLNEVAECVVVAPRGPDGPTLTLYYVTAPGHELDEATARRRLSELLPSYAVPATITRLPALPAGGTGKVDRAVLEQMATQRSASPPRAAASSSSVLSSEHQALEVCWSRILGVPPAAADTNFFATGGTSLAAARLAAMLKERYGLVISLHEIFDAPTPAEMAKALRAQRPAEASS